MKKIAASYKLLFFSVAVLGGIAFLLNFPDTSAAPASPVTSGISSRPTYSFSTEVVGASAAHIVVLNNLAGVPDYKWQFLDGAGGVRLLIDRKQGAGWEQIISQIQTTPEYKKQQGAPGSFVWNTYGLNGTTVGGNVLREWDRQNQADGSVKFVRTSDGSEEGVTETLTETWTIPASKEGGNPKATYQMTQNRGIVLTKGILEGTWRMKWALSGISDIVSDNSNIVDTNDPSGSWGIRKKSYSNGEFSIDVNDFDNGEATSTPLHTYSEIGANNKAEILFWPSGTEGTRLVDPVTVTQGLTNPWKNNSDRVTFYNGTRFFVLYNDTIADGNIYYKSSTDGTTWTATSTLVSDQSTGSTADEQYFNLYLVNDSLFDFAYINASGGGTDLSVRTCSISGSTITCGAVTNVSANNIADGQVSIARAPSSNRIWVAHLRGGVSDDLTVEYANEIGDAGSGTTWTQTTGVTGKTTVSVDMVSYENSDKVLVVGQRDNGGTGSDGYYYGLCDTTSCGTTNTSFLSNGNGLGDTARFGNLVRVNDGDFRFVFVDNSGTTILKEYKFDGVSTWTDIGNIDTGGSQQHPSISRDLITGTLFAQYVDTSATPDVVYRYQKALGGAWQNKSQVDASESTDRSYPIYQLSSPAATSTSQTRDNTFLTWAYRFANGSVFDIAAGNLKLEDLSWATTTANFEIYQSSVLTWDAGTKICGGTLTDDNSATIACLSGTVGASTEYRIQVELDNLGTSTLGMSGSAEYVDHVAVKGGWAGTTPTISVASDCAFEDFGGDDGSTTCNVAFSGNDVRVTNTGTGDVTIGGGEGEGFMYLITTGTNPATDSTSYMNTSIGTTTPQSVQIIENSSKITISAAGGNSAPSISNLVLDYTTVTLTENTYMWASSSMLVTDTDDCSEIASVTATFYLASTSNSGTLCTYDGSDCYTSVCVATTTGNTCTASDTTEEYDCGFQIWYTANATDSSAPVWASSIWSVSATATDATDNGTATNTTQEVEVGTLNALNVSASIAYPDTAAGANTGTSNQTVTVTNTGNTAIDTQISGDVMCTDYSTCLGGVIDESQQKFDTSDVTYSSLTNSLSATATPATIQLNMAKPTATTTPVTQTLYWGIGIPDATPVGDYTGQNTFTAVADS